MSSHPVASPSRDSLCVGMGMTNLCYGRRGVLRGLRFILGLCPTLQGESLFSGPPPPHLSDKVIPMQPCFPGSGEAAPCRAELRWKGLSASVMRSLFGFFPVPKLTFSVPFFGVREESDGFPNPAFSSLPFSQLNQSPAAQVSMSLTSWVIGALQLFGPLFGRTSQHCPGFWGQPTSQKVSSVSPGG